MPPEDWNRDWQSGGGDYYGKIDGDFRVTHDKVKRVDSLSDRQHAKWNGEAADFQSNSMEIVVVVGEECAPHCRDRSDQDQNQESSFESSARLRPRTLESIDEDPNQRQNNRGDQSAHAEMITASRTQSASLPLPA